MDQDLILVNELDEAIGFGEKMAVHQQGLLHRAFSIFVVNANDEFLLQKRAYHKYHSGGLWTNTCCCHPVRGEDQELTIHRRLQEEMGFDCELEQLFRFIYEVRLDNELTEHEYDHVYLGRFDGKPQPNPDEVADYKWLHLNDLRQDLKQNPADYTFWFNYAFDQFYETYYCTFSVLK